MQTVSREFKEAVYAPARKINTRVRFELINTTAHEDNTPGTTDEAIISRLDQVTNQISQMSSRYAALEGDYLLLNGDYILPAIDDDKEYGWWSESITNKNMGFDVSPLLTFDFTEKHSSAGLTIIFSPLTNEYATDFTIKIFGESGDIIIEEDIENNNLSTYILPNQLTGYKKIQIAIHKWNKPYRRVKITEVDFGVVKTYDGDNLINLDIIKETDIISKTIPLDELNVTVDNSNREFNILNPKGYYESLQQGQEFFVEMGVETAERSNVFDYIDVGKFYLRDWAGEEGSMTAHFRCNDVKGNLSDDKISNQTPRNITLYDLAIELLEDNDIYDYEITTNLQLINTKGIYKDVTPRQLLQMIAVAGKCVVYTDNHGKLHIKEINTVVNVPFELDITNESDLGSINQLLNSQYEPTYNIPSFEQNRFKLDGSFEIISEGSDDKECGWWSNLISDANGNFSEDIEIVFTMGKEHYTRNFNITFDEIHNQHPISITIEGYGFDDNLKFTETVDVDDANFQYFNNNLENTKTIKIIISNWNAPYRRCRILEVGFDLPVDSITFDNIYLEPKVNIESSLKSIEVIYYDIGDGEDNISFSTLNEYMVEISNSSVKQGDALEIKNTLINTKDQAMEIGEWILKEGLKVAKFEIDWRQNPALELMDLVSVENLYETVSHSNIIKQEIKYNGALSGKTTTKGVI